MFLQRSTVAVARRAALSPLLRRGFASTAVRADDRKDNADGRKAGDDEPKGGSKTDDLSLKGWQEIYSEERMNRMRGMTQFPDIKEPEDLIGPGAPEGTVPTALEQETGLARYQLLAKLAGNEAFPYKHAGDVDRKGTLENPLPARTAGDEQYIGCTGWPVDSHGVIWITVTRDRPVERCPECGNVFKLDYVGPPHDDAHAHHGDHHAHQEPKTFADYVKPEYWYGAP